MDDHNFVANWRNYDSVAFYDANVVIFAIATSQSEQYGNLGEIRQISACCNGNLFTQYFFPDGEITNADARFFGLERVRTENGIRLFRHGNEVDNASPKIGLENFLEFLSRQINSDEEPNKVLLVAHDCCRFDGRVLVQQINEYDLSNSFEALVLGFLDTTEVFKSILPNRNEQGLELQALAIDYLAEYNAQELDASGRIAVLVNLTQNLGISEVMTQHARHLLHFILLMPEYSQILSYFYQLCFLDV